MLMWPWRLLSTRNKPFGMQPVRPLAHQVGTSCTLSSCSRRSVPMPQAASPPVLSWKPRAEPSPDLCSTLPVPGPLKPNPPIPQSRLCLPSARWLSGRSLVSSPSLARGKVQTVPPPSQASRPLLNLHFENVSGTSGLQATATHPPSLPLPVRAAPPTGTSLPISPALFTLWRQNQLF